MKKLYTILTAFFMLASIALQAQSILLVNDNGYKPERADALKTALENLDYAYTYYNTTESGGSPTADFMKPFDLVIWYTGNDSGDLSLWNGDDTENEELKTYLDQGGMMWLQGLDFLYDYYGSPADTFQVGDFVYDYLGIEQYVAQSHKDDGVYSDGVPFFEVVPENGIFTLDSLEWQYSTMWYADALIPIDGAKSLYVMGPADYDLGGFAGAIYNEKGDAKVMTFTTETARLDAQWRLDTLFSQGLRYFKQFASTSTNVESISVTTEGNATTIDTKGGTLQCSATVLPDDATNKNIVWKLENNNAYASIDQNGLLKAAGLSFGNGTVMVVAEAADGSGVTASVEITISNQGESSDYEILLVNDNANGATRYLELDTALINLDKNHAVYNTVVTGTFPDLDYLSYFDVVIWYTGNDGADLTLWDVSDSTDLKFNAPLKSYLDQGGFVWLQGLDFFYDLYKEVPKEFVAGDFVYDYMGINLYAAQSHKDDGGTGVAQLDLVQGNGICELNPIQFSYSTMWFVDALGITDNAQGIYNLGPSDYVFFPFYAMVYNRKDNSKLITSTFETARLDDQSNLDQLFLEVLDYFKAIIDDVNEIEGYANNISIYPNPASDFTTLSYELSKNSNVQVVIYSIDGQKVYENNLGTQAEGYHSVEISTSNTGMSNGTYLCTFRVDDKQIAKRIVVIK